ncbi:dihydrofolate reductase [Miniphocaeibacter massiliensis]|uniref:dihydrofolate reductase n=1 Tax=Miniphocaeibacter massiliensis TaxID=2041841 RepID=UPI000C1BD7F3|nr:dihydrofolate reductase [Miniphocaeibacter massiliensis]
MKSIVAVDINWGIGKNNDLLISIPDDMKHFIKQTKNKVVVMGKNTLDSFPGGNPLKGRTNIVISSKNEIDKDVILVSSIEELLKELKKYNPDDVLVVGGASVYKQLLNYCSECIVTEIDESFEADTYYPNLDKLDNWEIAEESEEYEYNGIKYKYLIYKKLN